TLPNYKMLFPLYPETSRVWIYGADRFLSGTEEVFAQEQLDFFIHKWAAHGTELAAEGFILHHTFVVIVADEEKVKASGCSIDSSVRFIKELGKELQVDFFNRLSILIEKEGELKRIHFNQLDEYKNWNIFDTTITRLDQMRDRFTIPVLDSGWMR
ncbi:MAG: hypothetical protein ACK46O_04505, partial [Flavobacteriia bacterium]